MVVRLRDVPELGYLSSDLPNPRGEICVKSPAIFSGYYKRPDLYKATFDAQGFFKTGDIAEILPNGALKIIDRVKNVVKLNKNQFIALEFLESVYCGAEFVLQILVHCDGKQAHLAAIVVIDQEAAVRWAEKNSEDPSQDFSSNKVFKQVVLESLKKAATEKNLGQYEEIKNIHLTNEKFTPENQLLTPSFKVRRQEGYKKYESVLDALYQESSN